MASKGVDDTGSDGASARRSGAAAGTASGDFSDTDCPYWYDLKFADLDTPHWLPDISPQEIGQAEPKLTAHLPGTPLVATPVDLGRVA